MAWYSRDSPLFRLWPGVLVLLGAALADQVVPWRPALEIYSPAALMVGVLLAWWFRSGRVVLALLALGLADPRLAQLSTVPAWPVLWVSLLPLNLGGLAILEESPPFSRRTVLRLSAGISQIAAIAVVLSRPETLGPAISISATAWPWIAGMGLAAAGFAWRRGPVEASLLWAAVLIGAEAAPMPAPLRAAAAGALLVLAVLEVAFSLAWRDELTGLPSRRAFESALRDLPGTYSLAMVDVDHFKRFNDRHGHDVGDQVLRRVGAELRRWGRAYRYGGEEFVLVYPGLTAKQCRDDLELLREGVSERAFVLRAGDRPRRKPRQRRRKAEGARLRVTVSVGVADSGRGRAPAEVLKAADRALYRAKRAGRNRVEGGGGGRRVARKKGKG